MITVVVLVLVIIWLAMLPFTGVSEMQLVITFWRHKTSF